MVLPLKVIDCARTAVLKLLHPVTLVGVIVGVSVMVGVSVTVGEIVAVGVMVGVSVNTGVFVAVLVAVLVGVGVSTVGVKVGVDGMNVEGGTVTTMDTLTKMVRALFALIGSAGVSSFERLIKGISLGTIGR